METHYVIQAGQIFIIFFIMLGPFRLMAPFGMASAGLSTGERTILAAKSCLIALFALILAGFIGSKILEKWNVQPATLLLSAGILFLVSALPAVLKKPALSNQTPKKISPSEVALNIVISPYGLATVIVLISLSHDRNRLFTILGCLAGVMVLDILFMSFTKYKDEENKSIVFRILMTILATLQLALALEIIIKSLKLLEVI